VTAMVDVDETPPAPDLVEQPRSPHPAKASHTLTLVICLLTSFVGAAVGFALQPMIARMLLPSLGGTASVWNTSVLFFQIILLAGYSVTHLSATRVAKPKQGVVQMLLVLAALIFLPVRLRSLFDPPADGTPTVWLIVTLAISIGIAYLALTTTSPFVQQTFARSGHKRANDPYFLYAASNVGSLAGLIAYPFLIEPNLGLNSQRKLWSVGYLVFAACVVALVILDKRNTVGIENSEVVEADSAFALSSPDLPVDARAAALKPSGRLWARWIGLAIIPASISLGATTYLTTDVAPVPLIWVLCLALYLLSYIIAFAQRRIPVLVRNGFAALCIGATTVTMFVDIGNIRITIAIHLAVVFSCGLAYHARLADLRPNPKFLTSFYVALSIGGIGGSLINAFIGPIIFSRQIEYPLMLSVAVLFLVTGKTNWRVWLPTAVVAPLIGYGVVRVVRAYFSAELFGIFVTTAKWLLVIAAVIVAVLVVAKQSHIAAAIVVALGVMGFRDATVGSILFRRSFYGAVHVDEVDGFRQLVHGTTTHGYQFIDKNNEDVATSYYTRNGPLGQTIIAQAATLNGPRQIGVLGLGTGTVATYLAPGDRLTYYEIDKKIVEIATDPKLFTFVSKRKSAIDIVIGDGRKAIAGRTDTYDLLVIDAFSSDAIPTHLLTTEAVELYRSRLKPNGILAVHISNRYLDLEPVVGAIAAKLKMASIGGHHGITDEEEAQGGAASDWIFLANDPATLSPLRNLEDFVPTRTKANVKAWTDDRVDITSVLMLG
jgi:SAM-dependent methyltransferase